jgi:hypothetical protein
VHPRDGTLKHSVMSSMIINLVSNSLWDASLRSAWQALLVQGRKKAARRLLFFTIKTIDLICGSPLLSCSTGIPDLFI